MLAEGYANPDVVVDTAWVAAHLNDPGVRVVEVDEEPELYAQGHVPGAITLNWWDQLEDPLRRDVKTGDAFARQLGEVGIGDDTTVVFYGDKNNWFATYAYWLFKYNGHKHLKVMNGGRGKWLAEGRPVSTDVPHHPARTHAAQAPDPALRALRDHVLQSVDAVRAGRVALVDVRSPKEFAGEIIAPEGYPQEGAQRAGHVPGAANIPWAQAVREDGTFKSPDELRALYGGRGVTPDKEVIAYCRIGERSSHTWFVLKELLGYPDVRNYDGSWTEYGSIVGAPIERSA